MVLPHSLPQTFYTIKAFQNPTWAEQVRERLKKIKILGRALLT